MIASVFYYSGGSASETLFGQMSSLHNLKLLPPFALHHFDSVSLSHLRMSYLVFPPNVNLLEVPQICHKYRNAMWCSQHFGFNLRILMH